MKEVIRTNDPVLLSFARAMLEESGIESLLLDQHASILEGSIGAIQQRLMVREEDFARVKLVFEREGIAHELRQEDRLF